MKKGMVLFAKRPEIGGMKFYPLTGGRVAILEDRKNVFVCGSGEKEIELDSFGLFELMMVAAAASDELAELSVLEDREWKVEVRKFSLGEAGDYAEEFGHLVKDELEAIQASLAQPKKKRTARKKARRT
jgi:hypothetical protein